MNQFCTRPSLGKDSRVSLKTAAIGASKTFPMRSGPCVRSKGLAVAEVPSYERFVTHTFERARRDYAPPGASRRHDRLSRASGKSISMQ